MTLGLINVCYSPILPYSPFLNDSSPSCVATADMPAVFIQIQFARPCGRDNDPDCQSVRTAAAVVLCHMERGRAHLYLGAKLERRDAGVQFLLKDNRNPEQ